MVLSRIVVVDFCPSITRIPGKVLLCGDAHWLVQKDRVNQLSCCRQREAYGRMLCISANDQGESACMASSYFIIWNACRNCSFRLMLRCFICTVHQRYSSLREIPRSVLLNIAANLFVTDHQDLLFSNALVFLSNNPIAAYDTDTVPPLSAFVSWSWFWLPESIVHGASMIGPSTWLAAAASTACFQLAQDLIITEDLGIEAGSHSI